MISWTSQPLPSGIAERGERAVVGMSGRRAGHASLGPGVVEDAAHVVEHLADLDPAARELGAGLVDVVDRELQTLAGAGRRRRDPLAEDDRAARARGRQLHHPVVRRPRRSRRRAAIPATRRSAWPDRHRRRAPPRPRASGRRPGRRGSRPASRRSAACCSWCVPSEWSGAGARSRTAARRRRSCAPRRAGRRRHEERDARVRRRSVAGPRDDVVLQRARAPVVPVTAQGLERDTATVGEAAARGGRAGAGRRPWWKVGVAGRTRAPEAPGAKAASAGSTSPAASARW